jgi:2-oxoglutarate dehydrogenase E1 component
MTPKSLLRHPKVVSSVKDLAEGVFEPVLDDSCDPDSAGRLLLCSGEVYYELLARRDQTERDDTAIVRLELLFPFPHRAVETCLKEYSRAEKIAWVQEEHKNYGAWAFVREQFSLHFPQIEIRYIGRDESPTSATGLYRQFKAEQKKLIEEAL